MQDNEATVAQVRQQVLGLEQGHAELRQDLHGVEQKMDRGFAAVDLKIAAGFQAVSTKLDEKTTPQWQAYGVIASVLIAIGGALFWPIREQTTKTDMRLEAFRTEITTQVVNTAKELSFLQGQLHPLQKVPTQ
jgi:hypothetical protein